MESGRYLKSVFAKRLSSQPLGRGAQQGQTVTELFLCCDWEEPDKKSFSIVCTDGVAAFQLQGARHRPELPFEEGQYLQFCYNALCRTRPDRNFDFQYSIQEHTGQLQLSFTFTFVGTDGIGRQRSIMESLSPAPNPAATIRALLSLALKENSLAKDLHDHSQADFGRLQRQLGDCQTELRRHVEASKEREKELYTKFTLLLNSKAEKLKQLRDENTSLLSELTKWRPAQEEPGVDEGDLALQDAQEADEKAST